MSGHAIYSPLSLRTMTDEALLLRIETLGRQERESLVDVVEHLMEVDRREVALDRGIASSFEYCVRKLGYSDGAAFSGFAPPEPPPSILP